MKMALCLGSKWEWLCVFVYAWEISRDVWVVQYKLQQDLVCMPAYMCICLYLCMLTCLGVLCVVPSSGMIWSECKEIWSDGPREYIMHLWNVLDFGMLSIFVASFTARFMAFLKASKAQQYVDMHVPDEDLSNASLPEEIAYFTYGKEFLKIYKLVLLSSILLQF